MDAASQVSPMFAGLDGPALRLVRPAESWPRAMEFEHPDGGNVTLLIYDRAAFDSLCHDHKEPRPAYMINDSHVVALMLADAARLFLPPRS